MNLIGKYVISPIDNTKYCRKNGQFLRHLRTNGFNNYQDFFDEYYPMEKKLCGCGKSASFDKNKMVYLRSCGNNECVNKLNSKIKQNFSDEQKKHQYEQYKKSMGAKSESELTDLSSRRVSTGTNRNSFNESVAQREQTCGELYDDKKYNNSSQISQTKLNWNESRKQLFLDRLSKALGGKTLNDFHTEDMYIARRKMLEERGDIIPLNQLSKWKKYSYKTRNLTEKNYRNNQDIINPNNHPRKLGNFELDHIVPVKYGFMNDIPVELIACVDNLQMLTMLDNRSKGSKYEPV